MRRDKRQVKYIFEGEGEKETPSTPAIPNMSTKKSSINSAAAHLNIFSEETSGSNIYDKTNKIAITNNANQEQDKD